MLCNSFVRMTSRDGLVHRLVSQAKCRFNKCRFKTPTNGLQSPGSSHHSRINFTLVAAGTAILGMAVLGDSAAPLRMLCIILILGGVIGLKLVSGN